MESDRWQQVDRLLQAAMTLPPTEREVFLRHACAGDADLEREIRSLLASQQQAGSFLESPAVEVGAQVAPKPSSGQRHGSTGGKSDGLPAGSILAHYRIDGKLGVGGMGVVYRGHDTKLGRDVAIKVLLPAVARDPDRLARFAREAKVLAALNHPNIAAIYGLEELPGNTRAIVMELVEGPTLAERIASGPLEVSEALRIALAVADALEAAHDKGVVHRDLKPANIKAPPDATVKVLDLGLATPLPGENHGGADSADASTLTIRATEVGMVMGTPAYMSPEQASGKRVDKRADIWSFGVVLWEMLTGHRLFTGESISHTLADVLRGPIDFEKLPKDTPQPIRDLLRRCLDRNIKDRLRDIGEARVTIARYLADPVVGQVSDLPSQAGGLRHWMWPAVAAAATLALSAVSFLHFREKPLAAHAVRFEVRLPEKSVAEFFKLSPNGELLVISDTFTHRLEVRPLNSLEFRTLPGTENARYPFWSPDSGSIGFFAGGKLKKISVNGGPIQTLCDAANGRGGTWNRDGVIVFSPDPNAPLQRVSMSGGAPVAITKLGQDSEDHRFPEFLPDQRHFLYTVNGPTSEVNGIYAGSLEEGGAPVRLLPDISNAVYVPSGASLGNGSGPGYLLFRRDDTLMAATFDPQRLQLTGEIFPVAEQVGISANVAYAAFSASANGVLAHNPGGLLERELVWMDRAGKRLATVGKSGAITYEALSPDEKTVAYSVTDGSGHSDLWLYDLNRDSVSRFTVGTGRAETPIWSPNGSRIAYSGAPTTFGKGEIFQKPTAGGKEELLFSPGTLGSQLHLFDWSPDGKTIVYSPETSLGKMKADLVLLPMEGEHKPAVYLQTPASESEAQFSPDGHWMSYTTDESGRNEVKVEPIPPTGAKWQVSTAGGSRARWRKDGSELFYIAADRKLMAVPVKTSHSFQAGTPQELFPGAPLSNTSAAGQFYYTPSRDGQRFLMNIPAEGAPAQPPITVVLSWQAELKK